MEARAAVPNSDILEAQIKRLINQHLKNVCKSLGLAVSGPKPVLQSRIIECPLDRFFWHFSLCILLTQSRPDLHQAQQRGKSDAVESLRKAVTCPDAVHSAYTGQSSRALHSGSSVGWPAIRSNAPRLSSPNHVYVEDVAKSREPQVTMQRLTCLEFGFYKQSPFYSELEVVCMPFRCKARETSRETVISHAQIGKSAADLFSRDARCKVILLSGLISSASTGPVDISFPQHIEVKVNGVEVKANFRGLKNKPGTTAPVDVTTLLLKTPGAGNNIAVTYALTQHSYLMTIYLVRFHAPTQLVQGIGLTRRKAYQDVVREISEDRMNCEIMTTSSIMSLKCPLSTLRMESPGRSWQCAHLQCFDLCSFLQLQLQAPTWMCPICGKLLDINSLFIDDYVDRIVRDTASTVTQVIIGPTGSWSIHDSDNENPVPVQDNSLIKTPIRGQLGAQTTNDSGDAGNTASMQQTHLISESVNIDEDKFLNGDKVTNRYARDLVDLTLSSDDEEDDEEIKASL